MGTGAIGIRTAQLIQAFGAKVIAYSRSQRQEALDLGIEYVDLDSLLAQSDIISLHLPLTPETKHIIGPEEIEKMKDGVILINCSRGWLINSPALANALKTGKVAQVGLDVLEMEAPIPPNHILLHTPHVTLTPHIGFYTQEALVSRADIVFDNILAWLQGEPVNLV